MKFICKIVPTRKPARYLSILLLTMSRRRLYERDVPGEDVFCYNCACWSCHSDSFHCVFQIVSLHEQFQKYTNINCIKANIYCHAVHFEYFRHSLEQNWNSSSKKYCQEETESLLCEIFCSRIFTLCHIRSNEIFRSVSLTSTTKIIRPEILLWTSRSHTLLPTTEYIYT